MGQNQILRSLVLWVNSPLGNRYLGELIVNQMRHALKLLYESYTQCVASYSLRSQRNC